ncbi:Immunity protein 35 [Filimonas lacunae]|uniref:Immunity protein 35 n=1 Tax=Filimonas lacunae TaxID=477680 RepID=A0A1N7QPY5_9BACT|nr:YrhB domain-containing protein [Filimonas lacunae]SIT24990.1 Immunity protein 35 [Filimonas lacunae]
MLNLEQAQIRAQEKLTEIESRGRHKLCLLSDPLEFKYGWVFFYQSEEYIRKGDIMTILGGNAPILVDKYSGLVLSTGTRRDISYYIEVYSEFREKMGA